MNDATKADLDLPRDPVPNKKDAELSIIADPFLPFIIIDAKSKLARTVDDNCKQGSAIYLASPLVSAAQMFMVGNNGSIVNVKCNVAIEVSDSKCHAFNKILLLEINGTPAQSFKKVLVERLSTPDAARRLALV